MQNIEEIFDIAVKIEINGERFYRTWADKTTSTDAKVFFTYLADEELKHQSFFAKMKSSFQLTADMKGSQAEFAVFLRSYINDIVFNAAELENDVTKVTDLAAAVRFGMRRETQSILFYEELKRLVPAEHHAVIDAVIKEEVSHYVKLSNFLNSSV